MVLHSWRDFQDDNVVPDSQYKLYAASVLRILIIIVVSC